MSNRTKESDFTVSFQFPNEIGPVYPANENLTAVWTAKLSDARIFKNKKEAKEFGERNGGKYGWCVMPTVITIVHADDVIVTS